MCVFLIVLVKKLGILFQPSLVYLYFYQHDDHRVCIWLVYWRKIEESRANLLNKHKNTYKFFFGIYLHFQIISLCKLYTSNIVQKKLYCEVKSQSRQTKKNMGKRTCATLLSFFLDLLLLYFCKLRKQVSFSWKMAVKWTKRKSKKLKTKNWKFLFVLLQQRQQSDNKTSQQTS